MSSHVGIDVHKETLVALALKESGERPRKTFDNTGPGRAKLVAWCKAQGAVLCGLESTGPYSASVAFDLNEAGLAVVVANPRAVRDFARALGSWNKTDKADALVIARYVLMLNPSVWVPPPAEVRRLTELSRRLDSLKELKTMETNKLENDRMDAFVRASVADVIAMLEAQIESLESELQRHVEAHGNLKRQVKLLVSIPGIAFRTACSVLAEMATGVPFKSASELCAYAGLSPRRCESGQFTGKTMLSKRGNSRLRRALYMPAVVAVKWNQPIRAFYERMIQAGKTKMAALGACMRKLLTYCFAVLNKNMEFSVREA